jgi:hypothetical protein
MTTSMRLTTRARRTTTPTKTSPTMTTMSR